MELTNNFYNSNLRVESNKQNNPDYRLTYLNYKEMMDGDFKQPIKNKYTIYEFKTIDDLTGYIFHEVPYLHEKDVFLMCLIIIEFAIRRNEVLPFIRENMCYFLETNFFEHNIDYFKKDDDYDDIARDYEIIKKYFNENIDNIKMPVPGYESNMGLGINHKQNLTISDKSSFNLILYLKVLFNKIFTKNK